ncbi:MAG: acetylglutamate kinase [Pirellulales bacterium]
MVSQQHAMEKADVLIEALGWIRRFRDKITVIKLGGSVMETPAALGHLLLDIVFLQTVGMRVVVVHGGGAAINRGMDAAGLIPKFIQGRRYTDEGTLKIVEEVLAGDINEDIVNRIERLGGRAHGMNFRHDSNVLYGEKLFLDGQNGEKIDLGFVGHVTRVDPQPLFSLWHAGLIPVIPSMCVDKHGQKYNVNADTAATGVAQALGAEKLIFMSDVNGVRLDKNDPNTLIHTLPVTEARELIRTGKIESGMIPKVEGCLDTLDKGVRKIHIIDGRLRHSLLLEIYTNQGVGTEMMQDPR